MHFKYAAFVNNVGPKTYIITNIIVVEGISIASQAIRRWNRKTVPTYWADYSACEDNIKLEAALEPAFYTIIDFLMLLFRAIFVLLF